MNEPTRRGCRLVFCFTLACASSSLTLGCGDDMKLGSAAGGSGGSTTAQTSGSGGAGMGGSTLVGSGGQGSSDCSPDLHQVLMNGQVVKTCPQDQGCANGECVPACDAAKASQGNVGCDFVIPTPSFHTTSTPPCFAVFVANNWTTPVQLTVSYGSTVLDVTTFARIPVAGSPESSWPLLTASGLASGEVAVLFVSGDPNSNNFGAPLECPVAQGMPGGTAVIGTGRGTAFHIGASAPVIAYDILPYGGGKSFLPSAELLMPTSSWGTNYVAALPPANVEHWGQIVAAEDGTTIDVLPSVALPGGTGVTAAPKGVPASFTLDAGEVLQWEGPSDSPLDMSGTVLKSDKPFAFAGGSGYFCYGGGCDSAHQAIIPVQNLGSEYVASSATRCPGQIIEPFYYRIVGAADGTELTFDPPLDDAPHAVDRGQVADFDDVSMMQLATSFRVTSQDADHPFYLAQIMGGMLFLGPNPSCPGLGPNPPMGEYTLGDEEFVNVLSPKQFLSKYVFFTDPTYGTTTLVITRVKTASGFKDVTVDCLGTVGGWEPVGTSGQYETTRADIWRVSGVGSCQNGIHSAESDGPFGLTVWGLDVFSSYAYPAGGNAVPINSVVVVPK